MIAPIEVPVITSTGTCSRSSSLSTPTCASPRAPPESTRRCAARSAGATWRSPRGATQASGAQIAISPPAASTQRSTRQGSSLTSESMGAARARLVLSGRRPAASRPLERTARDRVRQAGALAGEQQVQRLVAAPQQLHARPAPAQAPACAAVRRLQRVDAARGVFRRADVGGEEVGRHRVHRGEVDHRIAERARQRRVG